MTVTDDRVQRAIEALEFLAAADIATMDRGGLSDVTAARRLVVGFCDQIDQIDRRVAQRSRELESEGRSESPADVLREQGRRSNRDARAAAGRAETAAQMPTLGDALGDGAITAGHLDAIANATAKLTNIRTWIDRETGMGHIHTELDPESHAKILASLRAKLRSLKHQQDQRPSDDPLAPLTHEQLEADAFIELIIGSDSLDQRVPDVIVLLDHDTLVGAWHANSLCETIDGIPIPPETVRRYCCTANIIPAVLGSNGQPLDVGAGSRLATPAQRRAIDTMYRTCAIPGCRTPVGDCEIHHLDEWIHNRSTDLKRLLPLCKRHHHLTHEGGWHIDIDNQRNITVNRPDGSLYLTGPTMNRLAS